MELQEVKIYKARLEKEYADLLSYRQGILEQVRIDEQLKRDISFAAKEIFDLRQGIKKLQEEINILKR